MKALALLLLCACDGWTATPKAGTRRLAEWRLETCIKHNHCAYSPACYEDVRKWCLDAGLEPSCGEGGATPACTP